MYISDAYWNHYIGDTDDSLTLLAYLARKPATVISVGEILSDFGLDRLRGDFRTQRFPLVFTDAAGRETALYYAIDLIADLVALLLECKVNGSVDLHALDDFEAARNIRITAGPEEHALIHQTLKDFASNPFAYDLSEMCPEGDLLEMAGLCESLQKELYEPQG